MTDRELLLERLERLAIVLDELMPKCSELVRDALALLKERDIVRCMECKHNTNSIHNPICGLDANRSGGTDWFCADGERRIDDA